jgi:Calcineurin-like phosphoesterase/Purple acid Phosphatase, N-terminal domain
MAVRHLPPLLALFILCCASLSAQIVPAGSTWKYLDDGTDQGIAWTAPTFNDSAWAAGPAQLGYGDGDEATVISYGPNSAAKYITSYFRHSFSVANPGAINFLSLGLIRDDGAVVYLNGVEIYRSNMPPGPINSTTQAVDALSGVAESDWGWISMDPATLLVGGNVLAVEIHQSSGSSSDLSFDLTLDENQLLPAGFEWRYLDDGSDQGSAWAQPGFNDSSWASGPSQLGYGDGDEATEVSFGGNSTNKFITTYLRSSFQIADPQLLNYLRLGLLRDDGAVVYLNGIEIMRSNMRSGPINFQTLASATIENSAENDWNWLYLDPQILQPGLNHLAVEVHQIKVDSSDISFNLQLSPDPVPDLVRGPYLQNGTTDSIVVRWRTARKMDSLVQFGDAPGNLLQSVFDPALVFDHEVKLTGLAPDTTYFYSIGDSNQVLAGDDIDHYAVSNPPVGLPKTSRIWVLGDCGRGNSDQRAVRNAYYNWTGSTPTNLTLLLGDNAYLTGTEAEYQKSIYDIYSTLLRNTVFYSARGNHDTEAITYYDMFTFPQAGEAGGLASGTEAYYSFDYANVHFLCLDSQATSPLPGGAMYSWLQSDLAATDQDWLIAFWHHPPYTKGTHDSDSLADSGGRMVDMRENILPLLEDAGVDLVFTGHSHTYERSFLIDGHYGFSNSWNPTTMLVDGGDGREFGTGVYAKTQSAHQGAVYTVTGSASQIGSGTLDHPVMYKSVSELGSVVLDVQGERIDVTFVSATGTPSDWFSLTTRAAGPQLRMANLLAGQAVDVSVVDLTPGNLTWVGYSKTGPGPTSTAYGVVSMSLPITQLGPFVADAAGEVHLNPNVPLAAQGLTIYSQAIEILAGGGTVLSNPLAKIVL